MKNGFINLINSLLRLKNSLTRPSKRRNLRLLREKNERPADFTIREADEGDIPKLAVLHVATWNETYHPRPGHGPSIAIREHQWREQFAKPGKNWFVLLIENPEKELIGFAKGQSYKQPDLPDYDGELNKIYILKDYQRLGLGKRLIKETARRFVESGITSMVLVGVPQNPSCSFHEAMGGKRLVKKGEVFQGGYGWKDLKKLMALK
jgi:ribosomal protein S18 acetylase RimI-like enzyme